MYMKICVVGDILDLITCAKFQNEIFRGYNFTGGSSIYRPLLGRPWNVWNADESTGVPDESSSRTNRSLTSIKRTVFPIAVNENEN